MLHNCLICIISWIYTSHDEVQPEYSNDARSSLQCLGVDANVSQ